MNNRDKPARPVSVAEGPQGDMTSSLDHENGEGLTKLEDLAMRLYVNEISNRPIHEPVCLDDYADFAIDTANIFFNRLDGSETSTTLK